MQWVGDDDDGDDDDYGNDDDDDDDHHQDVLGARETAMHLVFGGGLEVCHWTRPHPDLLTAQGHDGGAGDDDDQELDDGGDDDNQGYDGGSDD